VLAEAGTDLPERLDWVVDRAELAVGAEEHPARTVGLGHHPGQQGHDRSGGALDGRVQSAEGEAGGVPPGDEDGLGRGEGPGVGK
jgi:hypothetical protein